MPEEKNLLRIEISYKSVLFAIGLLISLWFLIKIREIIILVFLSIILLSGLLRPVEWLQSKKIPRGLSVVIVYVLIIAAISLTISVIVPPLISETRDFGSRLPQIVSTINQFFIFYKIPVENISSVVDKQMQQIVGDLISISTAIFSSIVLIVTLFVLTFYLLLDWKNFVRIISSSVSPKNEKGITTVIAKVENGLGNWVRGQLALSLTIGFLSYIGLSILGIPFALPLALIAAILEIVPIVGPVISAIPAVLVGLTISPATGLVAAALFFVIYQLENHIIVPMVMSKVVGLQPPIVILALLAGAKLAGIGGAFLAVPTVVVIKIILKETFFEEKVKEEIKLSGRE